MVLWIRQDLMYAEPCALLRQWRGLLVEAVWYILQAFLVILVEAIIRDAAAPAPLAKLIVVWRRRRPISLGPFPTSEHQHQLLASASSAGTSPFLWYIFPQLPVTNL